MFEEHLVRQKESLTRSTIVGAKCVSIWCVLWRVDSIESSEKRDFDVPRKFSSSGEYCDCIDKRMRKKCYYYTWSLLTVLGSAFIYQQIWIYLFLRLFPLLCTKSEANRTILHLNLPRSFLHLRIAFRKKFSKWLKAVFSVSGKPSAKKTVETN